MSENYIAESRKLWFKDGLANNDDLKLGCLQRIALATESMAKNYNALRDERDRLQRRYDDERKVSARLKSSANALRGVITKLKKGRRK